jgi:hypothetical protein
MKPTRTLLCTAAVGLATTLSVQANTLFWDFGETAQQTLPNYNNIFVGSGNNYLTTPNAIDSTGAATGIGLTASGFNPGSNQNGTTVPGAPANLFDPQATRDNMFGHTGVFGGITAPLGVLSLTGLNPGATYDFTFFGSRTGVSDNRETKFDVLGSGFALLNTANNTATVTSVLGATSDAFGNLTINVGPGPNNNNSLGFYYLGAMQVVAVPEPSSMALATLGGFGVMLAGRRFRSNRS